MGRWPNWRKKASEGIHWSEADARSAIAASEASGLSLKAFACRHGLSEKRLYWWRDRIGEVVPAKSTEASLVPVTVTRSPFVSLGSSSISIAVDDVQIEVADTTAVAASWVAELVVRVRAGGR
jgi:hypothetical protein